MTNCDFPSFCFPSCKRRQIEVNFEGGDVTSDGGVLLLSQVDKRLGLTERIARLLPDKRAPEKIKHTLQSLIQQRVYGIALGYEDLNDHLDLRYDTSLQTAIHKDKRLASSSTLCRLENVANRNTALIMHEVLVNQFIDSYTQVPTEIILDFDATDDLVHGNQEGRFFHGYYGNYCFLPLYVFCGSQLLVSYLRPANKDGALYAWAILSLLVKRIHQAWPEVKIILRGDSGFCRHKMLNWCDRKGVFYIIGMARNKCLEQKLLPTMDQAQEAFNKSREKQRLFTDFMYAAESWSRERRIVAKAEVTAQGPNPRFIVTNLMEDSQYLYDEIYCARGDMENRIKEMQLDLFSDRTSCHAWWPNQFRLLLSSLAYCLLERLRALTLQGTEFAKAQVNTIRLKLLKIGAVIIRNTRRIRFMLSTHYPFKNLFCHVACKLIPT